MVAGHLTKMPSPSISSADTATIRIRMPQWRFKRIALKGSFLESGDEHSVVDSFRLLPHSPGSLIRTKTEGRTGENNKLSWCHEVPIHGEFGASRVGVCFKVGCSAVASFEQNLLSNGSGHDSRRMPGRGRAEAASQFSVSSLRFWASRSWHRHNSGPDTSAAPACF
jgi:hypothetical protein